PNAVSLWSSLGWAPSAAASGAAEDFVASASSAASRLRRDQRAMKFSGSLILVLCASVRAAPAPPDRRGRVRACGMVVQYDARQRRHRSPRAPPPASAPHRRDRCPLRSRLRPRRDRQSPPKTPTAAPPPPAPTHPPPPAPPPP